MSAACPQTAPPVSATIEESMSTRTYLGSPTLTQQGSVPREASGFGDVADNAVVDCLRSSARSASTEIHNCSRSVDPAASPVDSAACTTGCRSLADAPRPMAVFMAYARVAETNKIAIQGSSQRALLRLMRAN